ncbi:MAG: hypothetical protein U0V73_11815 [Acidimicrobiia bacterium]
MDDAKWERYAALGGIWFVLLTVIGSNLAGAPPSLDDSRAQIVKYFADHSGALEAGMFMNAIGAIGLVWWFGSLWRLMVEAEGGRPRMAVVALGGLAISGALALASGAVTSTIALQHGELAGAATAKVLFVLSGILIAGAGVGIVVLVAAVTSLSYRTKLFAAWINVVGWIAALLFLVASFAYASDANAIALTGLGGFLLTCVWIVAVSVQLWKRAGTSSVVGVPAA